MENEIIDVKFRNPKPESTFEIMTLNSLFQRKLNHLLTCAHRLRFYLILIIKNGNGTHTVDFKNYDYSPGSIFTIGKNQVHKYAVNLETDAIQILFTEDFIIKYYDEKQVFTSQLIFNDAVNSPKIQLNDKQLSEISEISKNLYVEYNNESNDIYKEPILRSGLHTLLLKLERFKQKQNPISTDINLSYFYKFKNLVDTKCFVTRNVNDFCKELNVSYKKLNFVSKSVVNKTAKEFIDERLVLEIKRLLSNTNLPIKEISYRTGFDEPTNFVKYFKNIANLSPTDFRVSLK
jgi:AraC-like DNA-binding protein